MSPKTFKVGGDLGVNRLGYGARRPDGPGVWGPYKDPEDARALLRRAIALRVNFIDTADSCGPAVSEPMIGEALAPYSSGTVIATKRGFARQGLSKWLVVGRPEYLIQQVETSLRWLRKESLDLWQLHRIDPQVPIAESLGAISRLQDQGKIRHVGLSEVSVEQIEEANKVVPIVSMQNEYNISNRKREDVLTYCEKHGIAFIPWHPVAVGKLATAGGKLEKMAQESGATVGQLSLGWPLHRSPVILPIPGTTSIEHLQENLKAAELSLSDLEWHAVESAARGELEALANEPHDSVESVQDETATSPDAADLQRRDQPVQALRS